MAGTVYLRTNLFEVKLEGITFKTKDFESLCKMDFLFPDGKAWARPPIVGIDVMRHPRDPSILLLLLCFGVGCVILRFRAGESLPARIHKFLADKRIHLVGFGIPEKMDLFPFEELGLRKSEVDIGYLAAKTLNDPKYKKSELAELSQKVLGIKRMIGLTEASSFERHEQIKCAICQLFVTTVIAMGLLGGADGGDGKKRLDYSSKKSSFLKNLNSLHLLAEGWFKLLPKGMKKKKKKKQETGAYNEYEDILLGENVLADAVKCNVVDCFIDPVIPASVGYRDLVPIDCDKKGEKEKEKEKEVEYWNDDFGSKEMNCEDKKPIKGILKCPSTTLLRCNSSSSKPATPPSPASGERVLKRANSKGCNVTFKFH